MTALAGTGTLTRLALRRDRLALPLWALVTGGLVASGPDSLGGLYDTAAARAELAASMTANSSMRSLYGPVFSDSLGGLVAWRFGTFAAVLAAVASLIVVVRHTPPGDPVQVVHVVVPGLEGYPFEHAGRGARARATAASVEVPA